MYLHEILAEKSVEDHRTAGEEDDEKDNVASKDKKSCSMKKDRVFQSEWQPQSKYTWLAYDTNKKIMTCKGRFTRYDFCRMRQRLTTGPFKNIF